MSIDLRGRSVLSLDDLTADEIHYLLRLAGTLKEERRSGTELKQLSTRNVVLLCEQDSIHTRAAFEVAAYDQGANVTLIGPSAGHTRYRESIKDTARFLDRLYDAIGYIGRSQSVVEEVAKWACVPVLNGGTDTSHPTQTLADLVTMQECSEKPLDGMIVAFLGDGRSNVARSLAVASSKLGIDLRIVSPPSFWPEASFIENVTSAARDSGGRIAVLEHVGTGILGADFICTAPWFGDTDVRWAERVRQLAPFAVRENVMEATDNPQTKLMHSLPAWHCREDEAGARIAKRFGVECMEVCDGVFESKSSIVFDQAENRMHAAKALLVATLADRRGPSEPPA
ncbi:ornithine carbamoyltransferase (plasmid) [Ensifer sp. PDNC004]|uniref:ornithine carbamoyltransferase n=1 Tax=Ensifer sp. PDNC004 TaxID=2811423 RepID=UPI0019637354|nr:ornithine carbamoyltransferase [Ensifer sp. PDNC004]QRY70511.1 ornithine carbamoyltransferase [Ensifer sp. PDNC004]